MQICFFEDKPVSRFHPLTLTRPIDDLRIGIFTIAEKWQQALQPEVCSRIPRAELSLLFPPSKLAETKPCIWINSRYLPTDSLIEEIRNLGENSVIKKEETFVAAHTDPTLTVSWILGGEPDFDSLSPVNCQNDVRCISSLWDLFLMNEQEITADLARMDISPVSQNQVLPRAIFENSEQIFVHKNAVIEPGAVLLAVDGPVFIGKGAVIQAGAIIRGPAAICDDSTVKMSARICNGSTVGLACKVNGEINNSIIHSYSNKAHEGYLGNSLIGQWCNLGANTNVSNLKNNYNKIRIIDWQSLNKVETGQQFFGTVMGDHTKTAINTKLNTGTLCGVSCNIFTADFPPTYIPSFSWVDPVGIQPYRLDKALDTMQKMMARRNIPFTNEYASLMKNIRKRD
jgi:UDP-N-acetylglucosamine diphosphorylase/glucosamine-1-phosphate N-acetyltransferase